MEVNKTEIPDVLVLNSSGFENSRGFFMETYRANQFAEYEIKTPFVQDNHSRSQREVCRGLHYQIRQPQGKLVRVVFGEIFDVAVDIAAFVTYFWQVGR